MAGKTFIDILLNNCNRDPSAPSYIFLLDGENKELRISYEQLVIKAKMLAYMLEEHTEKGDRVLLFYPPGLEYIIALYACLFSGLIAVPAYPPESRNADRLSSIIHNSKSKIALCSKDVKENIYSSNILANLKGRVKTLKVLCTDLLNEPDTDVVINTRILPEDIAFLQYTSGSTSIPKGVMVSHENLVANCKLIAKHFELNKNSLGVSWLPPYHDMGLIGGLLEPIFVGIVSVTMSPASFARKPLRWLKAITKYSELGNVISGGPNFAYEMCCKFIPDQQLDELDLSGWILAYNGAEPVRANTIKRFGEKFKNAGFNLKNFNPVYGMAEGTLIISSGNLKINPVIKKFDVDSMADNIAVEVNNDHQNQIELVGCGQTLQSQKILIVEPMTLKEKIDQNIGEIWVKGPSIAKGYWQNDEDTQYTFNAYISGTNEGPYLRTGDLGFFDNDKNLFITGRIKDLIILRGQNYYPHDIEETIEQACEQLRPSAGGAFSVDHNDEEVLVIVYELKRKYQNNADLKEIKFMVKDALAKKYGLTVHDIVIIETSSFPKTTSGKLQRQLARELYLNKKLRVL